MKKLSLLALVPPLAGCIFEPAEAPAHVNECPQVEDTTTVDPEHPHTSDPRPPAPPKGFCSP